MTRAALSPQLLPDGLGISDARRRLYEAAIQLFGAKGYHGVSVRDIAVQLGLKPMALYAHVSSKQQLLFEIMSIGYTTHRDRVTAALLDAGREPEEQIRALTRAHVLVHLEYPDLARVTNRDAAALDEEQTAAVLAVRADTMKMFLDVIERGQRLAVFAQGDPRLAVTGIAAMGIRAPDWWDPATSPPVDEVADTYADFAVRLLTTP